MNISATALFGNDTIRLGAEDSGGPSLDKQVIGGVASEEYYLGMLGLNPKPNKFSALDNGQSSYITSLKDRGLIPNISFAYTAGARYRRFCVVCPKISS